MRHTMRKYVGWRDRFFYIAIKSFVLIVGKENAVLFRYSEGNDYLVFSWAKVKEDSYDGALR